MTQENLTGGNLMPPEIGWWFQTKAVICHNVLSTMIEYIDIGTGLCLCYIEVDLVVTGRFAPSSVRPLDVSPSSIVMEHKTKTQDVSPCGRIQRFLVTLYILSFIIFKLCLTTFIKANDDDDPA